MRDLIRALKTIDTPTIANAVEMLGIRGNLEGYMDHEIKSIFPVRGSMVGYAFTSETDVTSEHDMSAVRRDLCKFYGEMEKFEKKPIVIVMKDSSPKRLKAAVWGGQMSALAKKLGGVGMVTDGLVRDIRDAVRLRFRYFAKGSIAAHGYANLIPSIGGMVEVGGVKINSGDIIHADENGVVAFSSEWAEDVLKLAKEVIKSEGRTFKLAKSKSFSIEKLKKLWNVP